MVKNVNRAQREQLLKRLSVLCIKHFGKDFEHWNWVIDSGMWSGNPYTVAVAIELPKTTIDGRNLYSDPFIDKSGSVDKSLYYAALCAIDWIEAKIRSGRL